MEPKSGWVQPNEGTDHFQKAFMILSIPDTTHWMGTANVGLPRNGFWGGGGARGVFPDMATWQSQTGRVWGPSGASSPSRSFGTRAVTGVGGWVGGSGWVGPGGSGRI